MNEVVGTIDPTRHILQFDPHVFDNRRVDVIGCGAVGASIADLMARNGVRNLHLWDGDRIEKHNVANQRPYTQADMGKYKVEALAAHLVAAGAHAPTVHPEYITGPVVLGDVVFLAIDKMMRKDLTDKPGRKDLFLESMHLKPSVKYVIEVRMGVDELRVYGFNPSARRQVAEWLDSLYPDAEAIEGVCQAQTTVNDTASITAGIAVARFRHWYRKEIAKDPAYAKDLDVEQILNLRPFFAISN